MQNHQLLVGSYLFAWYNHVTIFWNILSLTHLSFPAVTIFLFKCECEGDVNVWLWAAFIYYDISLGFIFHNHPGVIHICAHISLCTMRSNVQLKIYLPLPVLRILVKKKSWGKKFYIFSGLQCYIMQ
jgi:hypothetical protein